MKRLFLTILLISCSLSAFSQSKSTIEGTVTDNNQQPVPGINVALEGTRYGSATDAEGQYIIPAIPAGNYTLVATGIGFKTEKREITINGSGTLRYDFQLSPSSYEMESIIVSGKSQLREVEEKAFNVDVVNTKKLDDTSLDLGNALDRASGVRVRQSGGVGSRMNFSLNGFKGNQVKFFIDGVPMENFGSSFQLNNIPVNLAERVEVYKGVVP